MTMQTMAATSLCVEDYSTGLIWEDGNWKPANFYPLRYVIRDVSPREPLGHHCGSELRQNNLNEEPVVEGYVSTYWKCIGLAEVGTELTQKNVVYCKVFGDQAGKVGSLWCDDVGTWSLFMQPSGEFHISRHKEGRIGADWGPAMAHFERATMTIAAGKCTEIEP